MDKPLTSSAIFGVLGTGIGLSRGVQGTSVSSYGTVGVSTTGIGVAGQSCSYGIAAYNSTSSQPALYVRSFSGSGSAGEPIIKAVNSNGVDVMSLDQAGNFIVTGTVTPSGTPLSITRTSNGAKVLTYSPRQSQPTTEDVGEAQLSKQPMSV